MAQIQNPYNGGAALGVLSQMAQFNPLANAGDRLGDISQLNQRDALSDLMTANGGNVNQSMAPIAMLATPEAQQMFDTQQKLQRTDRGLDQYDTQLGISQQNADTSQYSAKTGRMNYNLNNTKYTDGRSDMIALGNLLNGVKQPGATGVAGIKDTIAGVESGGNYNAQNPNSSASGKYQMIDDTRKALQKRMNMSDAVAATPFGQEQLMNGLMKEMSGQLKGLGLPVTSENALRLHQMGYPDFVKYTNGTLTDKDKSKLSHLASYKGGGAFPSGLSPLQGSNVKMNPAIAKLMGNMYGKDVDLTQGMYLDDYQFGNDKNLAQFKSGLKINEGKAAAKNTSALNSLTAKSNYLHSLIGNALTPKAQQEAANTAALFDIQNGIAGDGYGASADPTKILKQAQVAQKQQDLNYITSIKDPVAKEMLTAQLADGKIISQDDKIDMEVNPETGLRNYTYNKVPIANRVEFATKLVDGLKAAGYDAALFGDKKEYDMIRKAIARVATEKDIAKLDNGHLTSFDELFKKIGLQPDMDGAFGEAGANFHVTPTMKNTIEAIEIIKTYPAELRQAVLERDYSKIAKLTKVGSKQRKIAETVARSKYTDDAVNTAREFMGAW